MNIYLAEKKKLSHLKVTNDAAEKALGVVTPYYNCKVKKCHNQSDYLFKNIQDLHIQLRRKTQISRSDKLAPELCSNNQ